MKVFRYITLMLALVISQLELQAGIVPADVHSHISVPQPVIATASMGEDKTVPSGIVQGRDPIKKNHAFQRRERVKETFITTGQVVLVIVEILVDILVDSNCHSYQHR